MDEVLEIFGLERLLEGDQDAGRYELAFTCRSEAFTIAIRRRGQNWLLSVTDVSGMEWSDPETTFFRSPLLAVVAALPIVWAVSREPQHMRRDL